MISSRFSSPLLNRKLINIASFAGGAAALLCIFSMRIAPAAQAQQLTILGSPIKKSWGTIRGNYIDPQTRELRFIFEDPAGVVRIVTIEPSVKTAVIVSEMRRE